MHALALVAAAVALAASGWQALLADLDDGRIDGVYRCSTYRAAVKNAPTGRDAAVLRARLQSGRCLEDEAPREGRNYVADGVAVALSVVAVILLVRRRRQLQR